MASSIIRPEQILEAYYAYCLNKWATLTFDYQFVNNPGYNDTMSTGDLLRTIACAVPSREDPALN
jgi:hypothetical protein